MKTLFTLFLLAFAVFTSQAQWLIQPTGLPASAQFRHVSVVDANVVWAANVHLASVPPAVIRTANGGVTWNTIPLNALIPAGFFLSNITATDAQTAWITAVNAGAVSQNRIYKTVNGGQTWTSLQVPFTGSLATVLHFFDHNHGFTFASQAQGGFEIFTTSDGGTTWFKVPAASMPPAAGQADEASPVYTVQGNNVWVAVRGYRVYRSTDRGLTWTVSTPVPSVIGGGYQRLFGLAFSDSLNGLANDEAFLYRTTDGGATWTPVNYAGPLHKTGITAIPGSPGSYISAGAYYFPYHSPYPALDRGSSISTDNGNTWVSLGDSLMHHAVGILNNTTGWTGGEGVMHKLTGSPLSIAEEYTPKGAYTVFPNPAKGIVMVSAAGGQPFRLEVYDPVGNRINLRENPSFGKNTIDLSGRPKGLYLLHILTGEKRTVEKIVLQ